MRLPKLFDRFAAIWVADFEFGKAATLNPEVRCMVATEIRSGRTLRLWADELNGGGGPPFPVDDATLLVTFYATAELQCFIQLNWAEPVHVIDLFAEARCQWNGTPESGRNLLAVAARLGVPTFDADVKEAGRLLALRGGHYTHKEKKALLDYCSQDVGVTRGIFLSAVDRDWFGPQSKGGDAAEITLGQALLRGRYLIALAAAETRGIPIDVVTFRQIKKHWGPIKRSIIGRVNTAYATFDGERFVTAKFEAYLEREGIHWPRDDAGRLQLDKDVFKSQALLHPQIEPLRTVRKTLAQSREIKIQVGVDNRHRFLQSPFGTKTGRANPSTSKNIFGLARWWRALIQPEPNTALIYADYSQQEYAIAAGLSRDPQMLQNYATEDCYMALAIRAGAAPAQANKSTHGSIRELYKTVQLAANYGMGTLSLTEKLGVCFYEADALLRAHKKTYHVYWDWTSRVRDHAFLNQRLHTIYGWPLRITSETRPTSILNWPMQSHGSEMLRLAMIYAHEAGIKILTSVHDAILAESDAQAVPEVADRLVECMSRASQDVLPSGPEIKVDVEIVPAPSTFYPRVGEMWSAVRPFLEEKPARNCAGTCK